MKAIKDKDHQLKELQAEKESLHGLLDHAEKENAHLKGMLDRVVERVEKADRGFVEEGLHGEDVVTKGISLADLKQIVEEVKSDER